MIAPHVLIYVQPSPYTLGEMEPGSDVVITDRCGHVLGEYKAGSPPSLIGVAAWPVRIRVSLPGFDPFTCIIEQYDDASVLSTGGYSGADRFPGRVPR